MKNYILAILAVFIAASPILAQSPTPSPTPAIHQTSQTTANSQEPVAVANLGTYLAALPSTFTLPSGTVINRKNVSVQYNADGVNAQVTASYSK